MAKYAPKLPGLHDAQQAVANSEARWKILCAGRRFGKTRLVVQLCIETALAGGRAWWVAPTFAIARVAAGNRDVAAELNKRLTRGTRGSVHTTVNAMRTKLGHS